MNASPWFSAKTETPVNPGRYECEMVDGTKRMIEWDGIWDCDRQRIKYWRGLVRGAEK